MSDSIFVYRPPSIHCAWSEIKDNFVLVEDPIYESLIDMEVYCDHYGKILDSLDGNGDDSKVSFFYEVSPMNRSALVFRNEEARLFFREEAEELELIPKLVEVCEGESREEKLRRTLSTTAIKKPPKPIKKVRSDLSTAAPAQKIAMEQLKQLATELAGPRPLAIAIKSAADRKARITASALQQLAKLTTEITILKIEPINGSNQVKIDRLEKKINKINKTLNDNRPLLQVSSANITN